MSLFISYRRQDSADVTGRIYDALSRHFGKNKLFFDRYDIDPGTPFPARLDHALQQCEVVIAIVGPHWRERPQGGGFSDPEDFVRHELEVALERDVPIIPVLIRNQPMPTPDDLPPSLARLLEFQARPVRGDPDFDRDIRDLIQDIERAGAPQ